MRKKSQEKVEDINKISHFLARRDLRELHEDALYERYGLKQVDLILVLGNSIPDIALLGAKAYKKGLGKHFMIVGGKGHSTRYLLENVFNGALEDETVVSERSEARVLKEIVMKELGLKEEEILIEEQSTNCGSNAIEALRLFKKNDQVPKSVLLLQDPTMQRRSHASFVKEWQEEETFFVSYAPFVPKLAILDDKFVFLNTEIHHLWEMNRFFDLVLGEIPRLRDDVSGYGPNGKGFIVHVDIPTAVLSAFERVVLERDYKRKLE